MPGHSKRGRRGRTPKRKGRTSYHDSNSVGSEIDDLDSSRGGSHRGSTFKQPPEDYNSDAQSLGPFLKTGRAYNRRDRQDTVEYSRADDERLPNETTSPERYQTSRNASRDEYERYRRELRNKGLLFDTDDEDFVPDQTDEESSDQAGEDQEMVLRSHDQQLERYEKHSFHQQEIPLMTPKPPTSTIAAVFAGISDYVSTTSSGTKAAQKRPTSSN